MLLEHKLLTEKYRPHRIADCVLSEDLKKNLQDLVDHPEKITHMVFSGPAGCGKTTAARAIFDELGWDVFFFNASKENSIINVRTDIEKFCRTVSMSSNGDRKAIICDEADGLSPAAQGALRGVFEEYATNVVFVLTCNYKNKIIDAIHSRCSYFDFRPSKAEKKKSVVSMFSRLRKILKDEGIEYEPEVLAELTKKYMPDWRKLINEIQKYSASGKLDSSCLKALGEEEFKQLIVFLQEKNYTAVRKWVAENNDFEDEFLYRAMYDNASKIVKPSSVPLLVVILAKYQYQASFVADSEVNTAACLAEIMVDVDWAD